LEQSFLIIAAYLALGAFSGLLAGLLGVGGGLIIVPALNFLFTLQGFNDQHLMHLSLGTSLATILFTALFSIRAHHAHDAILWPIFKRLTPGILVGALLGAAIADSFSNQVLRYSFAAFTLVVAMQIFFGTKTYAHRSLPNTAGMTTCAGSIGLISAIFGIGGGTLSTPFLLWNGIKLPNAIATSAACGLPIAIAGAGGYMLSGLNETLLPHYTTGYIYWPAVAGIIATSLITVPIGARLTHTLPTAILKKVLAVLLIFSAIHLISA